MSNTVKLAILDVDGTLSKGSFGIRFLKALVKEKLLSQQTLQKLHQLETELQAGHNQDRDQAAKRWNAIYRRGTLGKKASNYLKLGKQVWQNTKQESMFPFVEPLFALLNDNGFEVTVISASPKEVIIHMCEDYGIDRSHCLATAIKVNEADEYLDEVEALLGVTKQKVLALKNLVKTSFPEKKIDWSSSLAIGDSSTDLGLMELVGNPLVMKTSGHQENDFHEYVRKKEWPIVNEETIIEAVEKLIG
jgi:HAD superfamily phosphoserine phosphatase-like hydrolase